MKKSGQESPVKYFPAGSFLNSLKYPVLLACTEIQMGRKGGCDEENGSSVVTLIKPEITSLTLKKGPDIS